MKEGGLRGSRRLRGFEGHLGQVERKPDQLAWSLTISPVSGEPHPSGKTHIGDHRSPDGDFAQMGKGKTPRIGTRNMSTEVVAYGRRGKTARESHPILLERPRLL